MKKLLKTQVYVKIDTPEKCKQLLDVLTKANEPIYDCRRVLLERGETEPDHVMQFGEDWCTSGSVKGCKIEVTIEQLAEILDVREFKVGDRVRVLKAFEDRRPDSFGTRIAFRNEMRSLVGKVGEIEYLNNTTDTVGVSHGTENWNWFKDCLELITEEDMNTEKNSQSQTITREQLKAIFDVACTTWKNKITKFAERIGVFENTVTFSNDEVTAMFEASSASQKEVLISSGLVLPVKDNSVDLSSFIGQELGNSTIDVPIWIGNHVAEEQGLQHKCFGLHDDYIWELGLSDSGNNQILIPKRK